MENKVFALRRIALKLWPFFWVLMLLIGEKVADWTELKTKQNVWQLQQYGALPSGYERLAGPPPPVPRHWFINNIGDFSHGGAYTMVFYLCIRVRFLMTIPFVYLILLPPQLWPEISKISTYDSIRVFGALGVIHRLWPIVLLGLLVIEYGVHKSKLVKEYAPEVALCLSCAAIIAIEAIPGFIPNTRDLLDIPAGGLGAALFYLGVLVPGHVLSSPKRD